MDDQSVRISIAELEKARKKLEDDLGLVQMHRFPAGLRGLGEQYIVPVLVAIGPYHHGSGHLQKMEEVKRAAASRLLSKLWPADQKLLLGTAIYKAVVAVAGSTGKLYADDLKHADDQNKSASACSSFGLLRSGRNNNNSTDDIAAMMFVDACFLLLYMEQVCTRFSDEDTLSKLLFSNRACIDSNIMLLENQIPWLVVQAVIDSLHPEQAKRYKEDVVGRYIALKGREFKILHEKTPRSFDWDEYEESDGSAAAPHLLGLLWRHKTRHQELKWPDPNDVQQVSAVSSAIELAEIGIELTASKTDLFTDMDVTDTLLFGRLSLAPLLLNDTRARCLVNMAAFEVASATSYGRGKDAVCSYLSLFSMLMAREEDVHELQAKNILCGHQTNAEMRAFFKTVVKHLPDTGFHFAYLMFRIEDYKQRKRMRTKGHKFLYNHFGTIIKALTIFGTLAGLFQALLALNQSRT